MVVVMGWTCGSWAREILCLMLSDSALMSSAVVLKKKTGAILIVLRQTDFHAIIHVHPTSITIIRLYHESAAPELFYHKLSLLVYWFSKCLSLRSRYAGTFKMMGNIWLWVVVVSSSWICNVPIYRCLCSAWNRQSIYLYYYVDLLIRSYLVHMIVSLV